MTLVLIWAVWLLVNLTAFLLYGADKRRAKKGAWRISEKTLLASAWLLGGVGAFLGMRFFRHKTKHLSFQLSVPFAAVISLAVMAFATIHFAGWA